MPGANRSGLARRLSWGLLAVTFGCGADPSVEVVRTPLHEGWELSGDRLEGWVPARVPGTVHTDLLAARAIPDPLVGAREDSLAWIGDEDWTYRLTFSVPPEARTRPRQELVFEGLDTYASVVLNGKHLADTDNMFREWRIPVDTLLVDGENLLEIRFGSAVREGRERAEGYPISLPQGNDGGDPPTRSFTRKAAYHFGWDWGPRYVTAGIWRPVHLDSWGPARILDVHWIQESVTPEEAVMRAQVEVESAEPWAGGLDLSLTSPDGEVRSVRIASLALEAGVDTLSATLTVTEPHLWWPRGMGAAALYRGEALLVADGGETVDRRAASLGLRTVELVTEPDSLGKSFYFRVNGRPLFARGANVVPLDQFSPRADTSDYEALFQWVVDAHMNMLRVWGGGIYERDLFYDLADRNGILVWQDFMFANALYPGDEAFLESVRSEAQDQVRRLRNHPSLALWCGNNEIREGWENWGWQESLGYSPGDEARAWSDYQALFHEGLPGVLVSMDPERPYWPSSPSVGWGHPESLDQGDSHYWGVWWGREPFQVYADKLPRFASEFGFQGYPDWATVEGFAGPGERTLGSPVMRAHQKHPTGVETLRVYLERELGGDLTDALLAAAGWPGEEGQGEKDGQAGAVSPGRNEAGLRDFVRVTQLLQARGMAVALEAHRMSPRTGGTLYWQLNDTWPVASWSSVDYFGRAKGLHHAARSAFAPLALSLAGSPGRVRVASDLPGTLPARLEWALALREDAVGGAMDVAGGAVGVVGGAVDLAGGAEDVAVPPGRGTVLAELPVSDPSPGALLGVRLVGEDGVVLARATRLFGSWQDLEPHRDGSGVDLQVGDWAGDSLRVEVEASRTVIGVHLVPDRDGLLSDDFFDLLPGERRVLWFRTRPSPESSPPTPRFEVWTLNQALGRLRDPGGS